jgi:thymidylate kinase
MRIVISGIDGSGKTTLCESLILWLNNLGHKTYFCKTTPSAYMQKVTTPIDANDSRISSLFFNLAQLHHNDPGFARVRFTCHYVEYIMAMEEVVMFEQNYKIHDTPDTFVIHDRHLLDRAVNAYIAKCPMSEINEFLSLIQPPDITLLLDLPVSVSQNRMLSGRGQIGQDETEAEQLPLRKAYLELAKDIPNIEIVDASTSRDDVLEQAKKKIIRKFPWKFTN